jgi:hypothetical protein
VTPGHDFGLTVTAPWEAGWLGLLGYCSCAWVGTQQFVMPRENGPTFEDVVKDVRSQWLTHIITSDDVE